MAASKNPEADGTDIDAYIDGQFDEPFRSQIRVFVEQIHAQPATGRGFESFIDSRRANPVRVALRRLHPDFLTWQACFDYVKSTAPLAINLPQGHKTNIELMTLIDEVRKAGLEVVVTSEEPGLPGSVFLCTRAQALEVKAAVEAPPVQPRRHYLRNP